MKKRNRFTQEQKEFLKRELVDKTASEVSNLFFEKYGVKVTRGCLNQFRFRNNIKLDYYESKIKDESQKKWLLNLLPYHDNDEAIELFKNKFGIELNKSILRNMRHNYKVKRVYKQKIRDTRFRDKIKKPLYNETIGNRGTIYVRVASRKYQIKSRFVWEQYYGRKIPKDYVVIFLNEKNNYDINNLALVKKGTLTYCCRKGIELSDKDIIKTVDMLRILEKKIKRRENYEESFI